MSDETWPITTNRFVAFFDIMGFKEMVERNDHRKVVRKLRELKITLEVFEKPDLLRTFKSKTRSITFSDSIVIFSEGDSIDDALKIMTDSSYLVYAALENQVAIKGAISFGEVTVDFENSLFFGRPIIDAHLLHDQLLLYSAIFDYNREAKLKSMELPSGSAEVIVEYKAPLRTGKILHTLIKPITAYTERQFNYTKKLYETVSGSPRLYVDNTLDFLESLQKKP